jgi:hypothetical protein
MDACNASNAVLDSIVKHTNKTAVAIIRCGDF